VQGVNDLKQRLIGVWAAVSHWLCCWSVVQTSSCLYLSQRRTFWIFTVTRVSQNVVNCSKLS